MSDSLSLISLFASSFLSATLLPGNSEVVLIAMLLAGASQPWLLVLIAIIGNSLGGVTNVILGRLFPQNIALAGEGVRLAEALRRGRAIIKLGACYRRFAVFTGGMDAHFLGTSALFFMPWQSITLYRHCGDNASGHDVVALIGLTVQPLQLC